MTGSKATAPKAATPAAIAAAVLTATLVMPAADAAAAPAMKSPASATACTPPAGAHAARIVVSKAYPVVSHPKPSTSVRTISESTQPAGSKKAAAAPEENFSQCAAAAGTA